MRIQYRYVNYGTTFQPTVGTRPLDDLSAPERLHENELAFDVGGCCWGFGGCEDAIVDHHFDRDGQFPSASAAVLHVAARIRERFSKSSRRFDNLWLISHREPDFDSFCSMYLARQVILSGAEPPDWAAQGLHPGGWQDIKAGEEGATASVSKIQWFAPDLRHLPGEAKWQVTLAAVASCTDNSMRTSCPAHLSLQSVLYAAVLRGRPYQGTDNGAVELFDHARDAILCLKLNPLVDSVLSDDREFAPELDLLDREPAAYARDLKRARKALVSVPVIPNGDFHAFYKHASATPLFDDHRQLRPEHCAGESGGRLMDGVYIRDPESILFKQWARQDDVGPSLGRGFTFTAIAYSGQIREAPKNQTNYYFSLDPERARGCHLYFVWALLEAAEINAILKPENTGFRTRLEQREQEARAHFEETTERARGGDASAAAQLEKLRPTCCRNHFEKRADTYAACLDDPWFDGVNYECTIIPAPNRGSLIGPSGSASDLSDDSVAEIVRTSLEGFYETARIVDYSASHDAGPNLTHEVSPFSSPGTPPPHPAGYFRLGTVRLRRIHDLAHQELAEQIGRKLWPWLSSGQEPAPPEFANHHLVRTTDTVEIWSRHGIFVAYQHEAEESIRQLRQQFGQMASLARELDGALYNALHADDSGKRNAARRDATRLEARQEVEDVEKLLLRVADFDHDLVRPGSLALNRMCEEIRLGRALATVRDLHSAVVQRNQQQKNTNQLVSLRLTQEKIEWIEVLIVTLYATEIIHVVMDLLTRDEVLLAQIILTVAAGFGVLAYFGLVGSRKNFPAEERAHLALRLIPVFVAVLLIALFIATLAPLKWLVPSHVPEKAAEMAQPSESSPALPANGRPKKQPVSSGQSKEDGQASAIQQQTNKAGSESKK